MPRFPRLPVAARVGHGSPRRRRLGGRGRLVFTSIIAVLAVLAAALLVPALRPTAPPPAGRPLPAAAPVTMTVTTAQARHRVWPATVATSGAIVPWQEALLGTPLEGLRVASVDADVGDVVVQGQVLARLDDAVLRAEAYRLQAVLAQAEALAAQAAADARRATQLRASGALSEQSILQAVTAATASAAAVRSAKAALDASRVEIAHAVLRAPDAGVISERTATLGAVPARGEPLFKLVRGGRLEWRGELTAGQLAGVAAGQVVMLVLPDGRSARATVRMVAPSLDANSRLGLVYAELDPGTGARAGMYVAGEIAQAVSRALAVPAAAVVVRDGRNLVFEVEGAGSEGVTRARPVEVGRRRGTRVEILSGLGAGARVAVEGSGFLADGDRVRIAPDRAAP